MSDQNPDRNDAQRFSAWPLLLLLVAAIGLIVWLQMRRPGAGGGDGASAQPFPPLAEVGGWLNTDGPIAEDDLRGQVVLVEYWFTTCPFCTARRPELIALHDQYGDQGLKVIGITYEPRELVEPYVQEARGMDWPIAYGAQMLIDIMGVQGFPTYTIYDRAGKSIYSDHTLSGAEDAIVAALAKKAEG